MINLTKQERAVVVALCLTLVFGLILDGLFRLFPAVYERISFMDSISAKEK